MQGVCRYLAVVGSLRAAASLGCVFGLLGVTALSGCANDTTIVKTVTAPSTKTDATKPATKPSALAKVGDTLTLKGQETTLKVRLTGVLDPLTGGEFDSPDSGKRYVGIKLEFKNAGGAAFSDAVSNGSTIVLEDNEQGDTTILSGGDCSGSFGSDVKIAPGDTRAGCIPFEVPSAARLRSFQFTPDSGFADATGEWAISSSTSGSSSQSGGPGGYRHCDANISAKAGTTTCAFAQNVFYEYFTSGRSSTISAYSPTTNRTYPAQCSGGAEITCTTDDGGGVQFPSASLDNYSQSQADRYAKTHQVGP